MSQDDILFDDVKYREPERRRRLDRDRRWACLAYETPGPIDLPIFLDRQTADAIERHALRDTSVELGGILLGKECVDEETGLPFVLVTKSLEAKHYENTQASFTYTHDSWEEITRERDRLHPDLDIVGWYHTHPDFGIFLSSHDLFIHRNFFDQPLQVAYVVDPIRQTRGFFQWRDGGLDQVAGFFISAERTERVALSRFVNDLESIPNTDGGGGGLSPRLEAELIAMLTRPHVSQVSPVDRSLIAGLFTMLGVAGGVLLSAVAFWLYSMSVNFTTQAAAFKEQTEAVKSLQTLVKESAGAQRFALDTLLANNPEGKPEKLLAKYDKLSREREEALKKLEQEKFTADELARSAKDSKEKLEAAEKAKAELEKEAKAAEPLLKRFAELEKLERKALLYDEILDTPEGKSSFHWHTKSTQYLWFGMLGWGTTILMAGYVWYVTRGGPGLDSEPRAPYVPPPAQEEPPHQIT